MIRHQRLLSSAAFLCLLGIGVAVPGSVSAQPPPGMRGPPTFADMDLNEDGAISAEEFAEHRAKRQAARAAQGRPMRNAGQAPRFEDWDKDGNGVLIPQELAEGQQARYAGRYPGWGRGWGPGHGPGYGRGIGPGWGRGPAAGWPCWGNP